jgi:predicted anti-sigma-YlaC factor YlaD
MKRLDCETVCMAAMAREDGYISELSDEQIDAHLGQCEECRRELDELQLLSNLLDCHQRQESPEDLWLEVAPSIATTPTSRFRPRAWHPFLALGIILIIHRLVDLIPDRDPGLLFKLIPVLFVIALFSYLRENPFKINVALRIEGE